MTKNAKTKNNKHGASAGRTELPLFDPNDVVIVGHDKGYDVESHSELLWACDVESNDTPLNEASVRFTMRHGIMQAPDGRRDGDKVIIVFGRGRTRLLREANKRLVAEGKEPWLLPVKIVKGDDLKMLELRYGENSHRRALDPYVRATDAQTMLDKGKTKAEVADIMGVSAQQLGNILLLLELAPPVIKEVRRGTFSQTAATGLAKLPRADQVTKMKEILGGTVKPTVGNVRNSVRESNGEAPIETPRVKLAKAAEILAAIDETKVDRETLESAVCQLRAVVSRAVAVPQEKAA